MADKNAVTDYLAAREKTAGWGDAFQGAAKGMPNQFAHAAAGGLATAAVGAGIAGMGIAASKIMDAATKARDFRSMLENNADLQKAHSEDPKKINMFFSTLRTMNPEFSKDPLISGGVVRQMMEYPNGIQGQMAEVAKHRRDFQSPLLEAFMHGGTEGAKGGVTTGSRVNENKQRNEYEQQQRLHESSMPEVSTTYEHDPATGQEHQTRRMVKRRG